MIGQVPARTDTAFIRCTYVHTCTHARYRLLVSCVPAPDTTRQETPDDDERYDRTRES